MRKVFGRNSDLEWWTDIVKGTFSDGQWMEIFGMTKATFKILCDDLRPSFPDQARNDVCETLCHQPFAGQEGFISFFNAKIYKGQLLKKNIFFFNFHQVIFSSSSTN